ncbi:unnamed protein product [Callosobruchus maculatus]|uniref:Uncharacterized protein n=1 Tax=Callosobruchus maculatus TaxID=64391 RepID=A0A653BUJ0_CALMS|nr:unnamed protein product [Callosobruchus maculatus]
MMMFKQAIILLALVLTIAWAAPQSPQMMTGMGSSVGMDPAMGMGGVRQTTVQRMSGYGMGGMSTYRQHNGFGR